MESGTVSTEDLREKAVKRLKKRRDFRAHIFSYVVINAFLIGIWAIGDRGYFWPGWVLGGWGIGLIFNAWDVYGRHNISEDQIREEMRKLGSSG